MSCKITPIRSFVLLAMLACTVPAILAQSKRSSSAPRIDIVSYKIEAAVAPDTQEIKAAAEVNFMALEPRD